MANADRPPHPLRSDARGAIFVPALVMGALMTGALFYVAAAGDAILFRSELQNAADITAFRSAVWHARGMNLVAITNMLMSLALAVFAAIRIAEIVCFLLGLIPILTPVFEPAATALVESEPEIAPILEKTLKVVQIAQEGVSATVPYVAFGDAKSTPTAASTIWPLTLSLVPPQADALLRQPQRRPERSPAALPIQADNFGILCSRAVTFIPRQVAGMLDRAHVPFSGRFRDVADALLHDVADHVFEESDGIFCQPINGMIGELIGMLSDKACDTVQTADDEAEEDAADRTAEAAEKDGRDPPKRDRNKRSDGSKREPVDCGDAAKDATKETGLGFSVTSAKVWHPAKNGSLFMHSWSWAEGTPRLFGAVQRGIGIAGGGVLPSVTPEKRAEAMAEYYFDCDQAWREQCEQEALWRPNWTARIRRFRSPKDELLMVGPDLASGLLDQLQSSLGDHASELVGSFINSQTGLDSDNPLSRWLGERIDSIPVVREISAKIDEVVGDFRASSGLDELLDKRNYAEDERIH